MARMGYQYETSPRKLQPSYKPKKKTNVHIVKEKNPSKKVSSFERKKQIKMTFSIIAIFAILLTISYRNSQINEKFNHVQSLKREISTLQKENLYVCLFDGIIFIFLPQ